LHPASVHHPLPLENLVRRLELSGFHITPAARLRMIQVLGSDPGKDLLKNPKKLKFLLAPVVAMTAAEQEQFYLIFDQFFQEISIPPKLTPMPVQGFLHKNLWWLLPIAFVAAGLAYLFWPRKTDTPNAAQPVFNITGPTAAQPGDTLIFSLNVQNTTGILLPVIWSLADATDQRVERKENGDSTWSVIADAGQKSPVKLVQAQVRVPGVDSLFTASTAFGIFCPEPPEFREWEMPASLEVEEPFTFRPPARFGEKTYTFEWSFGDGAISSERSPTHRYTADGVYFLQLKITKKGVNAICTGEMVHRIAIGEENILLAPLPLEYDFIYPRATWSWGAWLLLSLLAISVFYYMIRWFKRPYPQNGPQKPGIADESTVPDKGPYLIPFRPLDDLIPTEPVQYRLADMLRLRQEGLRKEVDVPNSIKATIEAGGYPRLLLRTNTQPTDYLILLDRQSANSHQARFFQYLAAALSRQEVVAEVFYFQADPYRLWNTAHPNGINLDMLYRLYPDHRLIVMGDAHELLDPYASGSPALRPGTTRVLKSWKQRLLLTPVAPCSWTFREAVLADVFVIFPADTEGLARASQFIENGLEPTDLPPSFREWQVLLAQERKDVDANYYQWRAVEDYEKYFADDPQMLRWIMAMAVFPNPNWEITLAIGAALGIEPRFDRLLQLSRIPWLQNGDLHPRLRKNLLARIAPQDESLARKAVKKELEAIADSAGEGFAALELQSNLAAQNFILSPYDPETQQAIQAFLKAGVYNKPQVEELARALPKTQEHLTRRQMSKTMQMERQQPHDEILQEFLDLQAKATPPPKLPERPVYTPDFWRMARSFFAFGLMIAIMWNLDSTKWLYRTVFGMDPEPYSGQYDRKMRDYVLVKESIFIDSAALLNNDGTRQYYEAVIPELDDLVNGDSSYEVSSIPGALSSFDRAESIKPGYALAEGNTAKLFYAAGAAIFNARRKGGIFLKKPIPLNLYQTLNTEAGGLLPSPSVSDSLALRFFRLATSNAEIRHNTQHAMGLAFYYLGNRDSASYYYNTLQKIGYFDSLQLFPNLKILLGKQETALFDVRLRNPNVRSVEATLNYFINPKGVPKLRWELEANDNKGPSPFVRTATAMAKFRRNTTTLLIQSPESAPEFRTGALRLRLRNLDQDALLIDTLLYWPKNWNVKKIPEQTTLKAVTMDERSVEMKPSSFNIIGQILDSVNNQPLANVKVKLLGNPKTPPGTGEQETVTDQNGYYILKLEALPNYRLRIQVERPDYEPLTLDLPPLNPRLSDQKLPAVRLKQILKSRLQDKSNNLRKIKNSFN